MNLYRAESGDPTKDAQANLNGRTHYVDSNTLRFHYSRILETHVLADGLFFGLVESVALDPDNKKRGFRGVLFNLFGTVISRPGLENTVSTMAKARGLLLAEASSFDAIEHTRGAIEKARKNYAQELASLTAKLNELASKRVTA